MSVLSWCDLYRDEILPSWSVFNMAALIPPYYPQISAVSQCCPEPLGQSSANDSATDDSWIFFAVINFLEALGFAFADKVQ